MPKTKTSVNDPLGLLCMCLLLSGCGDTPPADRSSADVLDDDWVTEEQERYERQMDIADDQLARNELLLHKALANEARWEEILKRWEQQADRYDRVLDKLEAHADSLPD